MCLAMRRTSGTLVRSSYLVWLAIAVAGVMFQFIYLKKICWLCLFIIGFEGKAVHVIKRRSAKIRN